ncbi:MAG: hypothetical protein H0W50_00385 [Parachlamydiaceae bacterium]|nr:hypothetical protein [Parachlamydiaceae bacterium]
MKTAVDKSIDIDKSIKARLEKNHACYVLLTCDAPQENGKMEVKLSYKGDPFLALYMLDGAQSIIDEDALTD